MPESSKIRLLVDGAEMPCWSGQTVASALLAQGRYVFRRSPGARGPRGPFCMMGACQECAIEINGVIRRACQTEVRDGMQVVLRGAQNTCTAPTRAPDGRS